MAKVHITLVGGQTLPVYVGIKAEEPEIVEFVYSAQSEPEMKRIKNMIDCQIVDSLPLDPTNMEIILEYAKGLAERYKEDDVTLNVTGGTKQWSILFVVAFSSYRNTRIITIDQNNNICNIRTGETTKSPIRLDIFTQIKLTGNQIKGHLAIEEYTPEDKQVAEKLRIIFNKPWAHSTMTKLLATSDIDIAKKPFGDFSVGYENNVRWDTESHQVELLIQDPRHKNPDISETFDSLHSVNLAFNSGWFEFLVADILHSAFPNSQILLNCRFPFTNNQNDKNEIDVIVEIDGKMIFVECKTQISNTIDIDKFKNAVRNYGGVGSKAVFITYHKKTSQAKEKCKESGIIDLSCIEEKTSQFNKKAIARQWKEVLSNALTQINTK